MPRQDRIVETSRLLTLIFNTGCIVVINLAFLILIMRPWWDQISPVYLRELWVLVNVSAIPALAVSHMGRHEQRAMLLDKVVKTTIIAVIVHALFFLSVTTFLHLDDMRIRDIVLYYAMMLAGLLIFRVSGAYALKEYRRQGYNYTCRRCRLRRQCRAPCRFAYE